MNLTRRRTVLTGLCVPFIIRTPGLLMPIRPDFRFATNLAWLQREIEMMLIPYTERPLLGWDVS